MTRDQLQRINTFCFAIILTSVICGLGIGIAGIWEQNRSEQRAAASGSYWEHARRCLPPQ